jgi:predicted extracellular nuclease
LAAAAIIDWIADDPTSSGDSDFLVIGDFNTYTFGDAMMLFANAGYVNVASKYIRPTPYSFEFDGQFGSLDHAVVTPSLAPQVAGAADWHINADEPPLNDYNLDYGRDPDIFDPAIPYRASDHDPLIVGFELSP